MPNCKNCGSQWSWTHSVKQILTFKKEMKCSNCGKGQYQSKDSLYTFSFLMFLPLILLLVTAFVNVSTPMFVVLDTAILLVAIAVAPFILKLSNEQKPLW